MKEQNKTLEKELNELETNNLLYAEFNTPVTRMLNYLSENFNGEKENIKLEIENIKKNQSEMKTTLMEMKNTL